MGLGLGRGWLKTPKPPPRGLGFGRGPIGVGLKPGVGRASKVTWRALNGQTKLMPPTQAPPYPMGVGFCGGGGGGSHSMCQQMPKPKPSIPHGLKSFYSNSSIILIIIRKNKTMFTTEHILTRTKKWPM
ncbi:hypothetical protein Hanom_Chr01g00013971 [Helianthus anomalus]